MSNSLVSESMTSVIPIGGAHPPIQYVPSGNSKSAIEKNKVTTPQAMPKNVPAARQNLLTIDIRTADSSGIAIDSGNIVLVMLCSS